MSEKLFCLIYKFNDFLPVAGGAGGAVSQAKQFQFLPTWEVVVSTIIITIIGAVLGYGVKLLLDIVFCKLKKKYKI